MKFAQILHNPTAGDEDHSKKELLSLIESKGFECRYSSTKEKDWDIAKDDIDFLVVAGGDGTVRKVVRKLVERKLTDKQFPVALLPMGTANNIASTLDLSEVSEEIVESWKERNIKTIDIGKLTGTDEAFFMEGFGFGVFPRLMKEMKSRDVEAATPEEELKIAQEVLAEIIDSYKAKQCTLQIDGIDHSGNFILVEVLNIKSIGPNLTLAPLADPGDGFFEVILISEKQREDFKQYVLNKLKGVENPPIFNTIKAKNVSIKWEGKLAHADDQLIEVNKQEITIELLDAVLRFLVGS